MPPNTKKRKTTSKSVTSLPVHTQKNLIEWGEKADALNSERGLLSLPLELRTEIFDYFPTIGPYTARYGSDNRVSPVLPEIYLVRIDILRALSQVCIDYRRVFLPLLWESFDVCFMREDSGDSKRAFYKHVGDALIRKCDGLLANPNLASYVGTVRVILTRYQSAVIPPKLGSLLSSLPNLHTLQVFHAHSEMTSAIRNGFEEVVLPTVRTLIIPGHCHEILKCCPQVIRLWCNQGDEGKLVTVLGKKYCKEVREMHGFSLARENLVKRIVKAAPDLRVLEISDRNFEPMVNALSFFKDINTIIIKPAVYGGDTNRCIEATKQKLKNLPPSKERRRVRLLHESNSDCYFSEVPI